ncbi:MarR family winged helix-turn-helix transcriptional regulator [Anaerosporobacter sp.]
MERKLGLLKKGNGCRCDISLTQCHALVEIGRTPGIILRTLADQLDLDISTMSRCIDSLVKKDFVNRKNSAVDRRCVILELTDNGQQLFNTIEKDMNDKFFQIFNRIPEEQRKEVLNSIDVILDAIQ